VIRVFLDGRIVPPEQATVSIFDRGFLYGDSIYEVFRTVRAEPLHLREHLARLARSAARIELPLPRDLAGIADAVRATLAEAANPDAYVRIIVTRGAGELDLDPAAGRNASLIVLVKPVKMPPEALYTGGAHVRIVGVRRTARDAVDPAVKSGNYLNNILALAEARRHGAYEAVMCGADGCLAEGASSNIFVVRGGRLETPALDVGILEGVTRDKVLGLCREAGIDTAEAHLPPDALRRADEALLTSSGRGVMPVTRVDGAAVGDGTPGPLTRRVMALYAASIGLA
jgi:branched-chain amino acid aminotransferase